MITLYQGQNYNIKKVFYRVNKILMDDLFYIKAKRCTKKDDKFLNNDHILWQRLTNATVEEAIYNYPSGALRECNLKNRD